MRVEAKQIEFGYLTRSDMLPNYTFMKRFVWHTCVVSLLAFDYFLFSTGNPSVTYSFLGGWFGIPLLAIFVISASFGYQAFIGQEKTLRFAFHMLFVVALSLLLFAASAPAREIADARLQAKVDPFIKDPINCVADVSNEERQQMVEIEKRKFTVRRTAFIPTFQRRDYLLQTEQGTSYLLVMETRWNGKPAISLRSTQD